MSRTPLSSNFYPKILSDGKPDEKQEMMCNKGLQEDDRQKFHTTAPEELTRNYSSV
jgi:hypothetical protein